MKINRNRLLGIVAIGLLAVGAGGSQAAAQTIAESGSFTLPFEVHWNSAVLPAGDYTFSMNSVGLNGTMTLRGPDGTIFLHVLTLSDQEANQHSALRIESRGDTRFVKELYLSDVRRHFIYFPPKIQDNEKVLARGPVRIENVSVSIGK
jgi:hypothetical protein